MNKDEKEFYRKIEDNRFILCQQLKQELIDRKLQRAYNQFLALNNWKQKHKDNESIY